MPKKIEAKFEMEKIAGSQIKLQMILPAKAFDKIVKQVANHIAETTKVDGFRKGKTPFSLIKKTIGEGRLLQEGAEEAMKQNYVDYVVESKIEVIGQPEVQFKKLAMGNDLEAEIKVVILPEVELSKKWEKEVAKINKKQKKGEIKVEDSEIQRELEVLAKQRAKISTVDRGAQKDDQVQVDFEAFKDNAVLEGGSAKDHTIIIGESRFIPGFEDNLIKMRAGEVKEFELKFPKEYQQKHLAGQKVTFKVTMKNVQKREIPEIDDKFASSIGKFKKLDEIKENIKNGIKAEKEKQFQQKLHMEILNNLIDKSKIEIPVVLIVAEIEKMKMELDGQLTQMGLDKNTYLQQIGISESKLEDQWTEKDAPKRVKASLILRYVALENKITPKSKDIQDRVNQVMQHYQMMDKGKKNEDIDVNRIYNNIKNEMTNEMTLAHLAGL
ncbi:MAG: trigger factor [Candidatus Moranbacteria bacterium]|nr:trigger factor [Candidatus Moranbacteria bacterium]